MKTMCAGWMAGVLLAAGSAWADAVPEAKPDPRRQGEADLRGRAERLVAAAREAFGAGNYTDAQRLALAALQLEPGNAEADEIHRLSIPNAERVKACRRIGERAAGKPLTAEETIERMTRARGAAAPGREEGKPDWRVAVEKKLSEKVSVGFKEARFSEVKDYLEGLLGCPVVLDRRLRDRLMALPVSLTAKDMPLEQILGWVVENDLGARWVLSDGALYISDSDGVTEKAGVVEAYDVSDLLYLSRMPDFVGPSLDPAADGANVLGVRFDRRDDEEPAPRRGLTAERLIRILTEAVEPGTWHQEVPTKPDGKKAGK